MPRVLIFFANTQFCLQCIAIGSINFFQIPIWLRQKLAIDFEKLAMHCDRRSINFQIPNLI